MASVFFAWLRKTLILEYGGAQLYLRLRPFFPGIMLVYFRIAKI